MSRTPDGIPRNSKPSQDNIVVSHNKPKDISGTKNEMTI